MKTIITNKKPALLNKSDFNRQQGVLFKKHNFCVSLNNGSFSAFSYEANFNGKVVDIKITNASTSEVVALLSPTIDRISREAIMLNHGTMNTTQNVVVYEDFCDALFSFVCSYISDLEDVE